MKIEKLKDYGSYTMFAFVIILVIGMAFSSVESIGVDAQTTNQRYLTEYNYILSDGETVRCLKYNGGYAGGLSCDWQNAEVKNG